MATKTDKYELRKKEDNDFYNIDDFNDNMDKIETALTEFDDSGSADGITSFTDMLTKLVTGNKLAVTLRNLKAGLQFVLHAGSIVNNCVTDNAKLPLSAAQGKALQDAIAKLNSEASARWNNATPKTLWINVIPSAINTDYKYQHNSLIGANMVSLAFESAVYDILILTGNGRTYGTTVANTFTDDPYWKSTIQASFDSNTGTVTFRILFKGSSQIFNNLALKAVTYLKIG